MIADKKSKIFLGFFAFITMISIVVTYYRYIVLENFEYYTDGSTFYELLEE